MAEYFGTRCDWAGAFIERVNLILRQHVPALGRRVLAYAQSEAGLSRQLALVYLYYNFYLGHSALRQAGPGRRHVERTPAMALGLTDRVWGLEELLPIRVPPWSQASVSMGAKTESYPTNACLNGKNSVSGPFWTHQSRLKVATSANFSLKMAS